jgi:hypothetical protein
LRLTSLSYFTIPKITLIEKGGPENAEELRKLAIEKLEEAEEDIKRERKELKEAIEDEVSLSCCCTCLMGKGNKEISTETQEATSHQTQPPQRRKADSAREDRTMSMSLDLDDRIDSLIGGFMDEVGGGTTSTGGEHGQK